MGYHLQTSYVAIEISGQNANDETPTHKTPRQKNMLSQTPKSQPPKLKNQWHSIHWRSVRGIMPGYQLKCAISSSTEAIQVSEQDLQL